MRAVGTSFAVNSEVFCWTRIPRLGGKRETIVSPIRSIVRGCWRSGYARGLGSGGFSGVGAADDSTYTMGSIDEVHLMAPFVRRWRDITHPGRWPCEVQNWHRVSIERL